MPARFWRQHISGISGFLVSADFWCQHGSVVGTFLVLEICAATQSKKQQPR
jgi:hypothetical protein